MNYMKLKHWHKVNDLVQLLGVHVSHPSAKIAWILQLLIFEYIYFSSHLTTHQMYGPLHIPRACMVAMQALLKQILIHLDEIQLLVVK